MRGAAVRSGVVGQWGSGAVGPCGPAARPADWPAEGADLAAINPQAHGTPFRELVRALDRAEGGEALGSLPGRAGFRFPHETEAEAEGAMRTWGQIMTTPAVAAY